ncbi:peptide chain release factor N(5)-glutamine methyltransferase [Rhizosphaericola mali]|uniref:Peptide chain release factor N(5)-glutamine methyltransferase n=1 Tax=Rhizosphaericola mali TaxID=2545455 RepID=A0A5P2G5I0_9BACT|nr:peptide chain release factor N(5)-glutamine methyltransferase [Rhizosphaericola mali]QES90785.1 peptide chain release factor N(5)-glutamine methyltransferase [Rhizosphaericola mali]
MTFQEVQARFIQDLEVIYDRRESEQITQLVLEKLTGWDRIKFSLFKNDVLSDRQMTILDKWRQELLYNRPVQYVIGEAWFVHYPFYVNENVLIPRPETEELVDWVYNDFKEQQVSILDIGTGSGCIAISLKKLLPKDHVFGLDISDKALNVAMKNAINLDADVQFLQRNILEFNVLENEKWDIIVSNPPYIRPSEQLEMRGNVLDFEPHLALFIEENDPLLFYRKIAALGTKHLYKNGTLYFEINEIFGQDVVSLLQDLGYTNVELKKDLQGKDRMTKAVWIGIVN